MLKPLLLNNKHTPSKASRDSQSESYGGEKKTNQIFILFKGYNKQKKRYYSFVMRPSKSNNLNFNTYFYLKKVMNPLQGIKRLKNNKKFSKE